MIRKFCRYYKPHLLLFALDFAAAAALAALNLVFPSAAGTVLDMAVENISIGFLVKWGALLLLLYVIHHELEHFMAYQGHVVGVRIERDLRRDLFQHILELPMSYFDKTKTGQLMSRLINDLDHIAELVHHGPSDFFISAVTLIGTSVILLATHWPLGLIVLLMVPVMLRFSMVSNRHMRASYGKMRAEIGDISAQVEDSLSGIRVVKSFTAEAHERERFARENGQFAKAKEHIYRDTAHYHCTMTMFSHLMLLITIIGGGFFMMRGQMSAGEVTSFMLYVEMFASPISTLASLMETYREGMSSFARFEEVMELRPAIEDKPGAVDAENIRGDIEFQHVSFGYDENQRILRDINLHIRPGEVVALVGPSGGGKTTLFNLIPRFYDPREGSIRIDGIDLRDMTQASLRRNIGIVQQDVFLFAGTIRENIAYAKPGATEEEIIEAAKQADAHEFIMALEKGYDTLVGQRGIGLSGGEKQRISIARIFLKNPPILLLDEATSAMDTETEHIVQESLFALSEGRTTLIIAHRLSTIHNSDSILVMTDEGIVEQGCHDDLMARDGVYAHLYNTQFEPYHVHLGHA